MSVYIFADGCHVEELSVVCKADEEDPIFFRLKAQLSLEGLSPEVGVVAPVASPLNLRPGIPHLEKSYFPFLGLNPMSRDHRVSVSVLESCGLSKYLGLAYSSALNSSSDHIVPLVCLVNDAPQLIQCLTEQLVIMHLNRSSSECSQRLASVATFDSLIRPEDFGPSLLNDLHPDLMRVATAREGPLLSAFEPGKLVINDHCHRLAVDIEPHSIAAGCILFLCEKDALNSLWVLCERGKG